MLLETTKIQLLEARETSASVLAQIDKIYSQEIRSEDRFLANALSELHNAGEIDVIQLVKGVDKSSTEYDFFAVLHTLEQTLPAMTANVEDILNGLVHLVQQAGRDLAIGGVYNSFQSYCSLNPSRPIKSIEFILSQDENTSYASFLSSSLLAIHSQDAESAIQTIEPLLCHKSASIRDQTYFALGRLDVDEGQSKVLWQLLSGSTERESDGAANASLLRAILNHGDRFPSYWTTIEKLLKTYLISTSPEVQYEISNIVAFQRVDIQENVLKLLLEQLAYVSPDHKGIISNINHLLVRLIEKNLTTLAIELLESILIRGVPMSSLDYFSRKLLNTYKDLLNQLITKWFLSGESSLCRGVSDLLHDVTKKNIELSADISILDSDKKQRFVCHKVVGWLFTMPVAAGSFLLSVYETGLDSVKRSIEQLLYNPLLLSYPGQVKEYLQTNIEIERQVELCERLLGELRQYHENLGQVSHLRELRAPSKNLDSYWKDLNRSMQRVSDEGPKSFFQEMCTIQNLLYGNSSIFYVHDGSGEQRRREMKMHTVSHSSEMPRLNVIDPENLEYMLRVYRYESMNNEANS
ncbi:MAG: hypothetical protein ACI9T7_000925 [Oleiphilaceae bacterium]|jgi:hypothetical protein